MEKRRVAVRTLVETVMLSGSLSAAASSARLIEGIRGHQALQAIEAEADRLILELYRDTYARETDPMRYMILKDLFELLEKAIDRCRDAGNVVNQVVLKNS